MFCEKCGSKLPDICVFCTNCGARVESAPVETVSIVPSVPVETVSIVPSVPVETVLIVPSVPVETVPIQPIQSIEPDEAVQFVPIVPVEAVPVQAAPVTDFYQGQQPQNPYQAISMAYQQPMNNQYMQAPVKVKKPFPVWINAILFIFAMLSVAALVASFVLGKMATKDSNHGGEIISASAKASKVDKKESQTEILSFELGGTVYDIEIPETEASIAGAEFVNGYIIENSDSEYLDYDYLIENYTAELLGYAYYEIYARYGVIFEDSDVADYFSSKAWYEPIMTEDEFIEDDSIALNDYEVANISTLEEAYDYLY